MQNFPIKVLLKKDFPKLLLEITDPPEKLFYRGNLNLLFTRCISVVGTRQIDSYGKQCISELIPKLLSQLTIVSGLAFGVDAKTHNKTLEFSGNTIAVLPSGLDQNVISPKTNLYLARKILKQNGLIISEYPNDTITQKWHFSARNRIIAGLSEPTLIIQGALKSGSLITAHHARDYNRLVAAIPGHIQKDIAKGCNSLISQGAYLISSANEILSLYKLSIPETCLASYKPVTLAEKMLLKHITQYPITIDKIYESCKLETKIINTTLSYLEIKGVIQNDYTGIYLSK